jgi:hypothetical protein
MLDAGAVLPSDDEAVLATVDARLAERLDDPSFCAEPGASRAIELDEALFSRTTQR